jgi:hypothetical protein
VTEPDNLPATDLGSPADQAPPGDPADVITEKSWLDEITDQLERDPDECWQAFEGLATVEADLRLSIIEELSSFGDRPGARALLCLLSTALDPATRAAARSALERMDGLAGEPPRLAAAPVSTHGPHQHTGIAVGNPDKAGPVSLPAVFEPTSPKLVRTLVTPVDGRGRGSIVVSVNHREQRRSAAFLCDVRLGIRDVVGEVEPESPWAGGLVDTLDQQAEGDCVRDAPELALGLLAGNLLLCGPSTPGSVRDWLLGTLGPGFQPAGFPATIPGLDASTIRQAEVPHRAQSVLDRCPSWLDFSPLTFELAEEISIREGRVAADRDRDAGAYRFLFEHRLIHRLELYRRMLLWMAWLWKFSGEVELARSALVLAGQLADEQYAVPSHPFTVELTTRSLKAAQDRLGTAADPRESR